MSQHVDYQVAKQQHGEWYECERKDSFIYTWQTPALCAKLTHVIEEGIVSQITRYDISKPSL